jgi:hypothetical protein
MIGAPVHPLPGGVGIDVDASAFGGVGHTRRAPCDTRHRGRQVRHAVHDPEADRVE